MRSKNTRFAAKTYAPTCWGVHYFLLAGTPFLAGEYTKNCQGVHYRLLGSTPLLVGQYTITCWRVHYHQKTHFLLVLQEFLFRRPSYSLLRLLGSTLWRGASPKQPSDAPCVVIQRTENTTYCVIRRVFGGEAQSLLGSTPYRLSQARTSPVIQCILL